jgi:hypothetical protein
LTTKLEVPRLAVVHRIPGLNRDDLDARQDIDVSS